MHINGNYIPIGSAATHCRKCMCIVITLAVGTGYGGVMGSVTVQYRVCMNIIIALSCRPRLYMGMQERIPAVGSLMLDDSSKKAERAPGGEEVTTVP